MSSCTPAGNDFTLDRESAIHVRLFIAARYAYIGMKAISCQLAVGAFTFAWPGEYPAGQADMAHALGHTRGIIAPIDEEKWVKAFRIVAERAERHGVDVALSMMPWNYTNTTGNLRRLVEKTGSRRLKVMWDRRTTGTAARRTWRHRALRTCARTCTDCT